MESLLRTPKDIHNHHKTLNLTRNGSPRLCLAHLRHHMNRTVPRMPLECLPAFKTFIKYKKIGFGGSRSLPLTISLAGPYLPLRALDSVRRHQTLLSQVGYACRIPVMFLLYSSGLLMSWMSHDAGQSGPRVRWFKLKLGWPTGMSH